MIIQTLTDRSMLKDERCVRLAKDLHVSAVFSALLLGRGVENAEQARAFLNPDSCFLHSPFLMTDMDKAVQRVIRALENKEKILIYGDYDADGVTALSVASLYFRSKGAQVLVHVPDRFKEGYGISREVLERYAAEGVRLVVTVDTGSKANDEIAFAASLGMDTVVTDHHECAGELPACAAVVDPMRPDCPYPFKGLAGVGVAFKLICAVERAMGGPGQRSEEELLDQYADLLAIGTVADVMPLTDENRKIVKRGLEKINESCRPGVRALIAAVARQKGKAGIVGVSAIGYQLAPRINASGRMANGMLSYRLLTTSSPTDAEAYAGELCALNEERQKTENEICEQALKCLDEQTDREKDKVIVLAGSGWHEGVIGIAASRICEFTGKPTILLSMEKETARGSGRSCRGIHLVSLLSGCADLLERFGGHELAAGLTIKNENIGLFRQRINELCTDEGSLPETDVRSADMELMPTEANLPLAQALRLLEPCGSGNEQPMFYMRSMTVADIFALSDGKHTRLTLQRDGVSFSAVYFGKRTCALEANRGQSVDLLFRLSVNEYQNRQTLQFVLSDLWLSECEEATYAGQTEAFDAFIKREIPAPGPLPTKEDFRQLYLLLKRLREEQRVSVAYVLSVLPTFDLFKLFCAFEALVELSLLELTFTDARRTAFLFNLPETAEKVDLSSASIYKI